MPWPRFLSATFLQLSAAMRLQEATVPQAVDLHAVKTKPSSNECARTYSPPMCQVKPGTSNSLSAHAVISTHTEDLEWLSSLPWEDNLTVMVQDRSNGPVTWGRAEESEAELKMLNLKRRTPMVFENIPNHGGHAAAYLAFIIKKYNKLPDVSFFLRAYRCSSRANFDMTLALPSIRSCFQRGQGYLDINTYRKPETLCKSTEALLEHPVAGAERLRDVWTDLFEEELGPLPTRFCWDGTTQFAVTRERIQKHPVSFYKKLFKSAIQTNNTLEFFWRTVFTPDAVSWKPVLKDGREKPAPIVLTPEEVLENQRYVDPRGQIREKQGIL